MTTDHPNERAELQRLRDEHRQISDLLSLIQSLTGEAIRSDSVADLIARSFHALHRCLPFDAAVAVMLEQNLDLHVMTRIGSADLLGEPLIEKMRRTLQEVTSLAFDSTDVVIRSEGHDLPDDEGVVVGDGLRHETHTMLKLDNRAAGLLLLYRAAPAFTEEQQQILEIFSTQVSMLLDNIHSREEILNLADTDDLTGIWNKRYFRRQLPQEIERARVYSLPLSLIIFDLDNFKQINDSFGHTIGDVVLSELCGAVREMLRPPDLFARFGGDEFAIILPHTDLAGACVVAERILQKVNMLTIPTDEEAAIRCSISIGVADFQLDDVSATDLVRRADERLYLAKRHGKNAYVGSAAV